MQTDELIKRACELARNYRISDGESFRLKDFDPADTLHLDFEDKPRAKELLADGIELLADLQEKLWASDSYALLLIFQAMDAAGKDSAIKHVMSGVNPQGCHVTSFKSPSSEELDHDFLWRSMRHLPERGRIGIFNRSYYEETLVVRVHPELLAKQKLPPDATKKDIWERRFKDIRHFENYLTNNGIIVRKFFLHVSKDEQKKRSLERLDNPEKHWKFSDADVHERTFWNEYMHAFEQTIRNTATKNAPWFVVPADNKWFTRLVVAAAIIDALDSLKLEFPKVSEERQARLAAARRELLGPDE